MLKITNLQKTFNPETVNAKTALAGLVNFAYNKKWNKNAIRFIRFDFIDDFEVSGALLPRLLRSLMVNSFPLVLSEC